VRYASRGRGVLLSDGKRRGGLVVGHRQFPGMSKQRICVKWQLTLMPYQSLRAKGSWALFLRPFLPLDSLLFLPTAILTSSFVNGGTEVLLG
jgi:hypothetical protein